MAATVLLLALNSLWSFPGEKKQLPESSTYTFQSYLKWDSFLRGRIKYIFHLWNNSKKEIVNVLCEIVDLNCVILNFLGEASF